MSIREILEEYACSEDNEYGNGDYTIEQALLAIKQEVKKVIMKDVPMTVSKKAMVFVALDKLFDEVKEQPRCTYCNRPIQYEGSCDSCGHKEDVALGKIEEI